MPWNNRCPPWALPRTRPSAVPTTSASPRLWESAGLALARAEDPQRAMDDIVATDKARTRNAVGRCRGDKDIALLLHRHGGGDWVALQWLRAQGSSRPAAGSGVLNDAAGPCVIRI